MKGGTQHKGHEFDKLSNVVGKVEEQLKSLLTQLSEKKKLLTKTFEGLRTQIDGLHRLKELKNIELEKFSICVQY